MNIAIKITVSDLCDGDKADLDAVRIQIIEQGETAIEAALMAVDDYETARLVFFCQHGYFPSDD